MALRRRSKKEVADSDDKPVRVKAAKAVSGNRFALFIGDEGTILIYIKDNTVQSRQFVPDASEQNLKELRSSLEDDPKAPILMIVEVASNDGRILV